MIELYVSWFLILNQIFVLCRGKAKERIIKDKNNKKYELQLINKSHSEQAFEECDKKKSHGYFKMKREVKCVINNINRIKPDGYLPKHVIINSIEQGHRHNLIKILSLILTGINVEYHQGSVCVIDAYDFAFIEQMMKEMIDGICACADGCKRAISVRCKKCGEGYCSKRCQKKQWNKHDHKKECIIRKGVIQKWMN